jgi:hypothetical protein
MLRVGVRAARDIALVDLPRRVEEQFLKRLKRRCDLVSAKTTGLKSPLKPCG